MPPNRALEPRRPCRQRARPAWAALVLLGLALSLLLALPEPLSARQLAPVSCKPQKAKEFLKRSSFVKHGSLDGRGNDRALRFRVEHYGRIEGVPFAEHNREQARTQAKSTRFFGIPISVHRAIEPALRCVERRIRANCKRDQDRYTPRAVGGFRDTNTYRGGEVSNHLFGIAVDIDPDRNPCCGCVQPWPDHPACQAKDVSVFERTALPMCWINAFERYGFYWLGRDPQLRDTMHFEFLGDPEEIATR
ncbi:MAG TPA: M15 family metallopeptidase [Polyangiaceae bacterium]|nr:M15 family metallopeptidase [Polyangiaceae bacterium]